MHVEKTDLQALLGLLGEAIKPSPVGLSFEPDWVAQAHYFLQKIIAKGETSGAKFTG